MKTMLNKHWRSVPPGPTFWMIKIRPRRRDHQPFRRELQARLVRFKCCNEVPREAIHAHQTSKRYSGIRDYFRKHILQSAQNLRACGGARTRGGVDYAG